MFLSQRYSCRSIYRTLSGLNIVILISRFTFISIRRWGCSNPCDFRGICTHVI
ncbi:hypothetical protein AHF37_12241 [Paragonimus kellicotti]|nr:hypothetical protein AHF37_12241 [Paragonimus kellicotti]